MKPKESKKQKKPEASPAASKREADVAGTHTQSSVPLRSKEKIKQDPKEAQIQELTNLLKKVQADFENYKKRVQKQQERFIEYSCQEFIKNLLPILDSFEQALKNTKRSI